MIVGADGADDVAILGASASLYASYRLKRVYYSAFSPTQHPSAQLAQVATPLIREHRLYQADWLLRFYGFTLGDLRAAAPTGTLDPNVDPKLAWALLHRETFPLDINSAAREPSLRVPGFGTRSVDRILASRRTGRLRLEDLARLGCALVRARPSSSLPIIILATCLTMRGCGRSLRRNHLNSYCSTSTHVRCGNCARCRRGRVPRCRPAMPRRECGVRHDNFR
jgi:predicted DNA-binding helix-hairpin-helix protein